jgi:hypothetical protein
MSSTPSTVERAFEAALYTDTHDALDTGASILAADPASDAELARRGRGVRRGAWRRGWQPADVVRLVRRELDDVHVRLVSALILAQAPDDRARGPRWTAQLDELTAEAAEAAGPPSPRTDRFTHATTVLELYRLLLRLPSLEPLDDHEPKRHEPVGRRTPACSPVSARCSRRPRRPGSRRRRRR